jgi:hypothetical protein
MCYAIFPIAKTRAAVLAALFDNACCGFASRPLKRARIPLILRVRRANARRVAAAARGAGIGFAGELMSNAGVGRKTLRKPQKSGADYT